MQLPSINDLKAIAGDVRRKTEEYDTRATVTRVTDSAVYVKFDGSDIETPIEDACAGVKPGDVVSVHVSHGDTHITGNRTDPAASSEAFEIVRARFSIVDSFFEVINSRVSFRDNAMRFLDKAGEVVASFGELVRIGDAKDKIEISKRGFSVTRGYEEVLSATSTYTYAEAQADGHLLIGGTVNQMGAYVRKFFPDGFKVLKDNYYIWDLSEFASLGGGVFLIKAPRSVETTDDYDAYFQWNEHKDYVYIGGSFSEVAVGGDKSGIVEASILSNALAEIKVKGTLEAADRIRLMKTRADGINSVQDVIRDMHADGYGHDIIMQSGQTMMVGAGESAVNLYENEAGYESTETLFLTADTNVRMVSNCQTLASKHTAELTNGGNFSVTHNNTSTEGTISLTNGARYISLFANNASTVGVYAGGTGSGTLINRDTSGNVKVNGHAPSDVVYHSTTAATSSETSISAGSTATITASFSVPSGYKLDAIAAWSISGTNASYINVYKVDWSGSSASFSVRCTTSSSTAKVTLKAWPLLVKTGSF